ncbi:hypothetical protein [Butyrivibrio sp. YAB3001]|uniref:hypothetical protein n=1 Tax=Butyrivibrio sp. YAB3001 TaxID=1520812 RepID=UPI0008F64383|nr:hypothetical protein [Butyrivibrio sp. YAB3001]SFC49565.1 hypothetical protein SAMN02910398_02403 [Butyrivibrio sp. YAB3001]
MNNTDKNLCKGRVSAIHKNSYTIRFKGIRRAVPADEQRIRELFIEMLNAIYHTHRKLVYSTYFSMLKNLIRKHFSYTKGLAIKCIETMETDI